MINKILYLNKINDNSEIIVYNYYKRENDNKELLILNTNKGLLYSNYYITKIVKKYIEKKDINEDISYIFKFNKKNDTIKTNNSNTSIIRRISFHKSLNINFTIFSQEVIIYSFLENNEDRYLINTNFGNFICCKYLNNILKINIFKFNKNKLNNLYTKSSIPYICKFKILKNSSINKFNIRSPFDIQFHKLLNIDLNIVNNINIKKIYDIDDNEKIYVYNFIKVITNKKIKYILETNFNKVYSNEFITPLLEKNIQLFDFDGKKYYKNECNYIFNFTKIINGYINNRKKVGIVEDIIFNKKIRDLVNNNITNIEISYVCRTLNKISNLKFGKKYKIIKIQKYTSNNKNKYIFKIDNLLYKSNSIIEKILNKHYNKENI